MSESDLISFQLNPDDLQRSNIVRFKCQKNIKTSFKAKWFYLVFSFLFGFNTHESILKLIDACLNNIALSMLIAITKMKQHSTMFQS